MHLRIARCLVGLLGCLVVSAVPRQLSAQREPPLWPGSRVRVTHSDTCCASPQVGSLVSVGPDSVVLRTERGADTARIALSRSAVKSVEQSWVTRSYGGRGAVLGALAGVGTGVATLVIGSRGCEEACIGALILAPYVVGGGAVVGALIGAAIGRSVRRDEWRRVRLPSRLGLTPGYDGGLALRLTLRF
jgi:hypothetical protein